MKGMKRFTGAEIRVGVEGQATCFEKTLALICRATRIAARGVCVCVPGV